MSIDNEPVHPPSTSDKEPALRRRAGGIAIAEPVPSRGVMRSRVFWSSMLLVVLWTFLCLASWRLGDPSQGALLSQAGEAGLAITLVGSFVGGLFQLYGKQNRPLGLGLLVGVVMSFVLPIVIVLLMLIQLNLTGGMKDW